MNQDTKTGSIIELNKCPLCKEAANHEIYEIGGNSGTQNTYGCNECGIYLSELEDWQSLTTTTDHDVMRARLKAANEEIQEQDELIKAGGKQAEEVFNKNHDLGFKNGLLEEQLKAAEERIKDLKKIIKALTT